MRKEQNQNHPPLVHAYRPPQDKSNDRRKEKDDHKRKEKKEKDDHKRKSSKSSSSDDDISDRDDNQGMKKCIKSVQQSLKMLTASACHQPQPFGASSSSSNGDSAAITDGNIALLPPGIGSGNVVKMNMSHIQHMHYTFKTIQSNLNHSVQEQISICNQTSEAAKKIAEVRYRQYVVECTSSLPLADDRSHNAHCLKYRNHRIIDTTAGMFVRSKRLGRCASSARPSSKRAGQKSHD